MKKIIALALLSCALFSCNQEPAEEAWKPLNLLEKAGVPITIMAPDSAEVKLTDLGILKDVTIQQGDDYYIQLYAGAAETNDIAKLKSDKLAEVKANRYFSKIMKEEEAGFIYETQIDSTHLNYGFRYAMVKGDMEYTFQTGLIGTFGLEEVERMYEAVKPQK
ncbi:MAG: hypothetical protein AAF798_02385 [Bacteroidota bacterium]